MALLWQSAKQDWVQKDGADANSGIITVGSGKKVMVKQFRLGLSFNANSPGITLTIGGVEIFTQVVSASNYWDFSSKQAGSLAGAATNKEVYLDNLILLDGETITVSYSGGATDSLDIQWFISYFELDQ